MLEDKSISMEKIPLPSSTSPQKVQDHSSERKIDDEASKWKSKSLNSQPTQHYEMDIRKTVAAKQSIIPSDSKKSKQTGQETKNKQNNEGGQKILPQPKIKKVNEKMFCITIDNLLKVFYKRIRTKSASDKNTFEIMNYEFNSNIEFIGQNGTDYIFVGTQHELIVLKLKRIEDKYFIEEKVRKSTPRLKAITFIDESVIVVSNEQVYQFDLNETFDIQSKKAIQFNSEADRILFSELKTINLVVQSQCNFYFLGTKMQKKLQLNNKKKFSSQVERSQKLCEVLHIVKFTIDHNMESAEMYKMREDTLQGEIQTARKSRYMAQTQLIDNKIASITIEIFPIDHVFEVGIFDKSKIYKLDEDSFLMSLHQQIILIKKHFKRYIVWDNVSIVSSKSQQKKGQLILADKRVLVYSQNGQIFAHDIYFNEEESRINMPPIDSFRGNDNDQQILYDAVLLQYEKDSLMKVLFYFKQIDVILPNKSKYRKQPDNPNDQQHDQSKLSFTMLCIQQSDPLEKLKQMIKQKKLPNQINEFCQRFGIKQLEKTKATWSVSEKTLKDIENALLQISDDQYIQTELDNILKKQPHNLTFLISVEKKQIARLKKLIVRNLLNDGGPSQIQLVSQAGSPAQTEQKRLLYVTKVIQWLMESIMFKKKLQYSQKFLSFKEYDFIEIGKLKAASLKEEIKLLSCKKYEKRLKYFLNSFRILAIANFQEIFEFLLLNKNQLEIKQFLIGFSFILPKFVETSSVFQKKRYGLLDGNKKMNEVMFKLQSQESGNGEDEKCTLWDDLPQMKGMIDQAIVSLVEPKQPQPSQDQGESQLNTIEDFQQMIIKNIMDLKKDDTRTQQQAINNFKNILNKVTKSKWFQTAAFKQHSMLNKTSLELRDEFLQLKNKKAYQILVKYLYRQIEKSLPQQRQQKQQKVLMMLQQFALKYNLIPLSFKRNDDARLLVYKQLIKLRSSNRSSFNMSKSQFLVLSEQQYFSLLFKEMRSQILKSIIAIYDNIEDGFFRERFEIYLKSKYIDLQGIIKFIDEFTDKLESKNAPDVRVDVIDCVKRLLKLNDYDNAREFIEKNLDKAVPQNTKQNWRMQDSMTENSMQELIQLAKIAYGFGFYHFFKAFQLDYTYQELIASTLNGNLQSNKFLQQLICKYCSSKYITTVSQTGNIQCIIDFENHKNINQKLNSVDIYNRPLEFFGLLLYLKTQLDFQVQEIDLYELMIENYLNQGKLNEEKLFNNKPYSSRNIKLQQSSPLNTSNTTYQNKFEQLWAFVKSIENYIRIPQDPNTKNYLSIDSFKYNHDAQDTFVKYCIDWINRKYTEIDTKQKIQPTLIAVKKVIDILQKSNKNTKAIKIVQAFFRLLEFLKKFNTDIMLKIQFIRKEQQQHSGFIFLIHMFREIGVDNFILTNLEDESSSEIREHHTLEIAQKKHIQSSFQTNTKIYNWMCIYSQYRIIRGEENIEEKDSPEFIRFIIEVCCIMVTEEKYEIAWDLLLRAVNQSYYFRDAFYYLASFLRIQNKKQFSEIFRAFLSTQTAKNLKSKLNIMIKGNMEQVGGPGKVLSFPQMLVRSGERGEQRQNIIETKNHNFNSIFIFQQLIQTNRPDEGFFFLIRMKKIKNMEIEKICQQSKRLSPKGLKSYLLLTAYMKCLQKYISKQFYPTFLFFKSKYQILIDNVERKDIIKDINIAISRLKDRIEKQTNELLKKDIIESKDELYHYYAKYMTIIEEPVDIVLTQEDEEQATKRIQMYARISTPEALQEENKEQAQAKLKLQQNQQKLQKVHQNNKLNVIHKEIQQSVSQAKRAADKYAAILEEKKKQTNRMTYAEKKEQELLQIKRKQDQEISSIKDSFKSNTTQKVNELIEQLRKKREKINESRYKSSTIRQEDQKPTFIVPQKDIPAQMKKVENKDVPQRQLFGQQSKYNIQVTSTNSKPGLGTNFEKPSNNTLLAKLSGIHEIGKRSWINQPEQKSQMQQKIKRLEQPTRAKVTIQQINEIFKTKQPQALKYLQKFDLIKQNMQVAVQLIKRVFTIIKDIAHFIQFLRYLLSNDQRYKQVLQQKSLAIVAQMVKMDQKISLKELIPIELFIQVHPGMTNKDYYNVVYEILKPNLKKILAQQKIAAHALGILMRYSLGSQTKYFHRVFADYITVLLKNYESKVADEKETFLLAEKLRSQFTNLEPQNREFVFEKLINDISNESKRKKLIEGLKKALQRKTDTTIGSGQLEQISRALVRLQRK